MADVDDRRPLVPGAAGAALWLDPARSAEQTEQLLRSLALSPAACDWRGATVRAGNVRNQAPGWRGR